MPKQALESLTESMFYLLMALTQGERCGTEITAFAAEITAGRVKIGPATLYTLLGKFEKEGLIAETSVLGCKRYYQITPAGAEPPIQPSVPGCALPAKRGRGGAALLPRALPGKELDDHDHSTLQPPFGSPSPAHCLTLRGWKAGWAIWPHRGLCL